MVKNLINRDYESDVDNNNVYGINNDDINIMLLYYKFIFIKW